MVGFEEFVERSLRVLEREEEHGDGRVLFLFLDQSCQMTISPLSIPLIPFRSYSNLLTIVLLH